jgi:hypothetical protein
MSAETLVNNAPTNTERRRTRRRSSSSSLPPHTPSDTLSPKQRKAFADLKKICVENKVYWPTSELEGGGEINEDITLLYVVHHASPPGGNWLSNIDIDHSRRYLRARQYDLHAAFQQYSATAAWRRKHRLDSSYDNVEIDKFEMTRRLVRQNLDAPTQ